MSEEPQIEISLGEGIEPVRLRDWDDADRWLASEHEAWSWLVPNGAGTNPGSVGERTQERLRWIRKVFNERRGTSEALETMAGPFQQVFNAASGPVVPSQSTIGNRILEIRASCGDAGAAAAVAFYQSQINLSQAASVDQLKAIFLLAFPALEQATGLAEKLSRERANLRSTQRNALAELREYEGKRERHWQRLLFRAQGIGLRRLRNGRDLWKGQQAILNQQQTKAIAELVEVKNTYEEAMRLQAPVRYWTQKARSHGRSEGWAIARLCLYFPLALCLLGLAFDRAFNLLLHGNPEKPEVPLPQATYFVVSGGLLLASTFAFWIGRLLSKLYLSEHHLRKDAHERAVMTTTYLALIRTGAASDAERTIILEALFRPSPDGIVRDEGPSDVNIGSILSRLGVR